MNSTISDARKGAWFISCKLKLFLPVLDNGATIVYAHTSEALPPRHYTMIKYTCKGSQRCVCLHKNLNVNVNFETSFSIIIQILSKKPCSSLLCSLQILYRPLAAWQQRKIVFLLIIFVSNNFSIPTLIIYWTQKKLATYMLFNYSHRWIVLYFGGQSLDTDPVFGRYWHFCGTLIDIRTDRNQYIRGT